MTDTTPVQPNRIYRVYGAGIGACQITVATGGEILDRPMPLRRWRHLRELEAYAARQRWQIRFWKYEPANQEGGKV